MNKTLLKRSLLAASAVMALGQSATSSAHELIDALGDALGATDLYLIYCGSGTGRLATAISAGSGAGQVTSLTYYDGALTSTSDAASNDGQPGPTAYLSGGSQYPFFVAVTKTVAGPQVYRFTYHCEGSGGAHTDTTIYQHQNQ